jgi:outer membrane PBP1 activator LpoA protein
MLPRSTVTAPCKVLMIALLTGCGATEISAPQPVTPVNTAVVQAEALVRAAGESSGDSAARLLLEAAQIYFDEADYSGARELTNRVQSPASLAAESQLAYALLQAKLAMVSGDSAAAMRWLTGNLTQSMTEDSPNAPEFYTMLGSLHEDNNNLADAINAYAMAARQINHPNATQIVERLWAQLQSLEAEELEQLAASADSYQLLGWIELGRVYRADEFNIRSQLDAIERWQQVWTNHTAAQILPADLASLQSLWDARPRSIALLLPLQQTAGIAIQEGFLSAYYEALAVSREVPIISVYDTSGLLDVEPVYQDAVAAGANLIIGPLNKDLVNQLNSGDRLPVPTLALNYSDSPQIMTGNLFQFGLAPEDEISQAAALAWNSGHRQAAIIAPDTFNYARLRTAFANAWQNLGGNVVSNATYGDTNDYSDVVKRLMAIDSSEQRAADLLDLLPRTNLEFTPRRRQDIDFIFLVANPRQGRLIKPTLAFYFAGDIPVYALPSIFDGTIDSAENRDLEGIWFTDAPWLLDSAPPLRQRADAELRSVSGPLQRLRALGVDSFQLYPRLQQLANAEVPSIPGTTGVLSLSGNQRIYRELEVARFRNGRVELQALDISANLD